MKKITSSIKLKLQISFLTFILLSSIAGLVSYRILNAIVAQGEIKSKIDQMVSHFAEARKQEKDFILYDRKEVQFLKNGNCESLQKHSLALREIKLLIEQIKASAQEDRDKTFQEIQTVKAAIEGYEKTFLQLANRYKTRGFKDHGLEGSMREVIHQLQECKSKEEQWYALMLRRHEKDFFIRQDPKYIKTLHQRALEFIRFVENSSMPHMSSEYKEKTIASIQNYVSQFNGIANIESEIGLNKSEGLVGILTEQAEMTEPLLANVQQMIYKKTQTLAGNSFSVILASGIIMLICGIGFSLFLARKISNPIIRLSQVVENARIGNESTSIELNAMKRKDELGTLVNSFKNMFGEINLKVQEISDKNKDLQHAAQKEMERKWFTEGISLFEGLMVQQASKLDLLADEFLRNLVKYTGSSQAALFLKEEDEQGNSIMQLKSCYASEKKRYVNKSLEMGEGLIGAVWQEKEAFYMNDIPDTYSKIRSGLGEAKPTAVFIVPALLEGEVQAIVEIATFLEFSENEKEFIQQVCKGLAGAISRARLQARTQLLLSQANTLTEELKQNEEEMRQQLEEMLSTQEEFEKNHQSLQATIRGLQTNLKVLSDFVSSRYKGLLIADEEYNLVYQSEYWQKLWGKKEWAVEQKVNALLNLSEKELGAALQHQHETLLKHLKPAQLKGAEEASALTDIKIEEYRSDQKVLYSIMVN